MSSATIIRRLCSSLLIIIFALAGAAHAAQDKSKKNKKKPAPRGTPVLWRAPSDIESRDLALGPGGAEMRPNLRRVTFLKKQEGGWSTEVEGGKVEFHFTGKNRDLFEDISVSDARWIGGWLSRLSARQIGDAFRAANYAPDEVQLLTDAVRRRVGELTALRGRAASAGARRG